MHYPTSNRCPLRPAALVKPHSISDEPRPSRKVGKVCCRHALQAEDMKPNVIGVVRANSLPFDTNDAIGNWPGNLGWVDWLVLGREQTVRFYPCVDE